MVRFIPMRTYSFCALAGSLLIPLVALAQTGEVVGTGGTLLDTKWQERERYIEGFGVAIQSYAKTEDAFYIQEQNRRQKLNDHRRTCTEELRKANRNSQFAVARDCYKTDAALVRDLLRKHHTYLTELPGISEKVRANVLRVLSELIDATTTISKAIDAGVYTTEADLLDAKVNLQKKYIAPYEEQLLLAKADRTYTWVLYLLVRIHQLSSDQADESVSAEMEAIIACYEDRATTLESILSDRNAEWIDLFRQAQSDLKSCNKMLQETAPVSTEIEQ